MSPDVNDARLRVLKKERKSLDFLLKYRTSFFEENIVDKNATVLEIGSGTGYLNAYLDNKILSTDIMKLGWLDFVSDALHPPLKKNSIDVVILNNVIHHFSSPWNALRNISDILKENGTVLIYDVTLSTVHKLLIKTGISKEKYDSSFDISNPMEVNKDPWMGNNAIPDLMFDNPSRLNELGLKVVSRKHCEFLIFLSSGGVTNSYPMPDFSNVISRFFSMMDKVLVGIFPKVFSLQQKVIIKKMPA